MKKILTMVLAALCAFSPVVASAIDVKVDKAPLVMDVEPAIVNGRTLVPMRSIFEALGAEIEWNNYTKAVTAQKDDKTIILYLNDIFAYIDGVSYQLDTPAVAIDGRTMVPARFVAESLDCQVYWDSYEKCVSIFTDKADAAAYAVELEQKQAARKAEAERIAAEKAEQARIAAEKAAQAEAAKATSTKGHTIYVTPTGKKYHYSSSCNGGTYIASTLDQALARGLTPCKKCVG